MSARGGATLRAALRSKPHDPHLNNAMANVLLHGAQPEKAAFFAEKAAGLLPGDPRISTTLGTSLVAAGRGAEAEAAFRGALASAPGPVGAYLGLTNMLHRGARYEEAVETVRAGLGAHAESVGLHATAITVLLDAGRVEEAVRQAGVARGGFPDQPLVLQASAFISNYDAGSDPLESCRTHRIYGDALLKELAGVGVRPAAHKPRPGDAGKRLRVGYLSPDFRRHSVAYFAEPLVEGHDRSAFEVACYSTTGQGDEVTQRFREHADDFIDASRMNDGQLAQRISKDGTDILIDLAGHTLGHRMGVLARRPAPVQATFIGYPNTTGLSTVDARIIDAITDPPGSEAFVVESLARLSGCFLCFRPPKTAPEVAPPPHVKGGCFTFGSFNILPKISGRCFENWVACMRAVPGSRFILKNAQMSDERTRARMSERFASAGIACDRFDLLSRTKTLEEHLALYGRIDLALDTFPYHGTTTTCEAMWMGVPTLTMAGPSHVARVGLSLNSAVGLEEFCAKNDEEFVSLACGIAGSPERLTEVRASMRERLKLSRMCDEASYVRDVEQAFRSLWAERACATA